MSIVPLNLPKANLKLKRRGETIYVWCIIRKKELVLTPEEWVRQHVVHFLINHRNVSPGLIASEMSLEYNGISKRADIVVFDRDGNPGMVVECKAPEVAISEATSRQIAQYNSQLNVDSLVMTNGLDHYFVRIDREANRLVFETDWPL